MAKLESWGKFECAGCSKELEPVKYSNRGLFSKKVSTAEWLIWLSESTSDMVFCSNKEAKKGIMAFFPSSSWPPIPDQIAHIAYLWCKNCDTVSILNYKKPIFSKGKWIVTGDKHDTSQWTRYQWEPFSKIANWHHDKQLELKEKELSKDKECPKCAETIKAKAVTCRFCGYDF